MFFDIAQIPERSAPAPATRHARILFDGTVIPGAPLSMSVFRFAPGQSGPPHRHETEVEVYFAWKARARSSLTVSSTCSRPTPHSTSRPRRITKPRTSARRTSSFSPCSDLA